MVVRERPSPLTLEDLQKGLERRRELLSDRGEQLVWENLTEKFGIPNSTKASKALQGRRDRILDRLDARYDSLVERIDKLKEPIIPSLNGNGHHETELLTPTNGAHSTQTESAPILQPELPEAIEKPITKDTTPTTNGLHAAEEDREVLLFSGATEPESTVDTEIEEDELTPSELQAVQAIESPSPFILGTVEEKPVPLEISEEVRAGVTIDPHDQSYLGALFINKASRRVLEEDAGITLDQEDEENAATLVEDAALKIEKVKDPSESALTLSEQLEFIAEHRAEFRQVSQDEPSLRSVVTRLLSSPDPSGTILTMFEAGGFVIVKAPATPRPAAVDEQVVPTQPEQPTPTPGEQKGKDEDKKSLDSSKIFILATVINAPVVKEALRAIGQQSLSSSDQDRLSEIIKATPMEVRQSLLASFKADFATHVNFMLDTIGNLKDYERETRRDARTVLSLLPKLDHEAIEKIKAKLVPQKQITS
ncbi:MAG TPA: hypothetical protein VG917_01240 [Patescibacteria group bacterium]|nr:hypothetical protein [Patescibacteria group bacterium]